MSLLLSINVGERGNRSSGSNDGLDQELLEHTRNMLCSSNSQETFERETRFLNSRMMRETLDMMAIWKRGEERSNRALRKGMIAKQRLIELDIIYFYHMLRV